MRYRNLQRISECTNTVEIIKLMDDADSASDSGSDGLSVSWLAFFPIRDRPYHWNKWYDRFRWTIFSVIDTLNRIWNGLKILPFFLI